MDFHLPTGTRNRDRGTASLGYNRRNFRGISSEDRMRRFALLLVIGAITGGTAGVRAQSQSTRKLSFEVASVKPLDGRPTQQEDVKIGCRGTDSRSPGITIPSGRCIARFQPLRL